MNKHLLEALQFLCYGILCIATSRYDDIPVWLKVISWVIAIICAAVLISELWAYVMEKLA